MSDHLLSKKELELLIKPLDGRTYSYDSDEITSQMEYHEIIAKIKQISKLVQQLETKIQEQGNKAQEQETKILEQEAKLQEQGNKAQEQETKIQELERFLKEQGVRLDALQNAMVKQEKITVYENLEQVIKETPSNQLDIHTSTPSTRMQKFSKTKSSFFK